jgi:hypothetical protein
LREGNQAQAVGTCDEVVSGQVEPKHFPYIICHLSFVIRFSFKIPHGQKEPLAAAVFQTKRRDAEEQSRKGKQNSQRALYDKRLESFVSFIKTGVAD